MEKILVCVSHPTPTEIEDSFFVPSGDGRARVLPVAEGKIRADDWVRALPY